MQDTEFNQGLLDFIELSPTPFHAVEQIKSRLECMGYQCLFESDAWQLEKGQGYYVTRNDSSIIAFRMGNKDVVTTGVQMVGAHTDSPCLKVKPQPEIVNKGYFQLGVEVYGGALLNPWFDRDLSLAGRVSYLDEDDEIAHALINFENPVAIIPSLAIHLDREANENRKVNAQTDLPPVIMKLPNEDKPEFKAILIQLMKQHHGIDDVVEVLDYELSFYDVQ
ncbi:MAG: M18 family aminopeptidase, partial [Gammaproteobacteria bacterium]|nr:M18 family aminopeptidase [Gammaproteobacteria bacterium]